MTLKTIATLLLGAAGFSGIVYADGRPSKTYYSQPQQVGNGTIRTYVTLGPSRDEEREGRRVPTAVGIEFPAAALQGLPDGGELKPWIIYFPPQARQTPFQYAMIDWNPQGHPPQMYQVPHFDFHFYIQDLEDVMNIKPGPCSGLDCADYDTAMKPIPQLFAPAGYINVGAVEPYMGNHLIDPTSPEFNGQPFTRTFIYGAYDGNVTFEEAMITRAFLLSNPAECKPFGLPQAYAETGYWPTKYCTAYNPQTDTYRVSLEGLTYRVAPGDRHHRD